MLQGYFQAVRNRSDCVPKLSHSNQDKVAARVATDDWESTRATYFELLRELQRAVRAVILAVQVGNSCVRCSDKLCSQLFQSIRACFIAGFRRIEAAKFPDDDLVFLLAMPEFVGHFCCDLEFIAYLCINNTAATFARQLFSDQERTGHFYYENAIMRDEELHPAFVSSLLALEPVNVHPDTPALAQRCLSASLGNLQITPVTWGMAHANSTSALRDKGKKSSSAEPDEIVPSSDMGALAKNPGDCEDVFSGFIAMRPRPRQLSAEENAKTESDDACCLSRQNSDDGFPISYATTSAQPSQGEQREATMWRSLADPLLNCLLVNAECVEITGGMEARCDTVYWEIYSDPGETEIAPARFRIGSDAVSAESHSDPQRSQTAPGNVEIAAEQVGAKEFAGPVCDAFGLEVRADADNVSRDVEAVCFGLRDLAVWLRTKRGSSTLNGGRCRPRSTIGGRCRLFDSRQTDLPPRLPACSGAVSSLATAISEDSSPRGVGESDEALDAVSSLENLWVSTRQDGARRLLRSFGRGVGVPIGASTTGSGGACSTISRQSALPVMPEGSMSSTRESPASSTVATPRGSTPTASLRGGAFGVPADALSDTESELSSSAPSSSALMFDNRQSQAGGDTSCPTPFGVHLEWHLKMRAKLQRPQQMSLQRNTCAGCKGRLATSSLFNAARYCYYLGCYFCAACHTGEARVIPARVVDKWDFEPRAVCSAAARFLDMHAGQPLVPITKVRQTKVSSQQPLTDMHLMRQKLGRIQKALKESTCDYSETLNAIMSTQVPPHIADGPDLYTMQELFGFHVEGRKFAQFGRLSRLVTMGAEHVKACPRCQASAGCCDLCWSRQPVFSFEVNVHRDCKVCHAVYHNICFQRAGSQCPKCASLRSEAGERPRAVAEICPR